jgi:glycosyltransferase involved in cell wall biosynthesis
MAEKFKQGNVCYVVPEHRADSVQHFVHVPHLIHALAEGLRVAVLVERGEPLDIPGVEHAITMSDRSSRNPLRIIEYVRASRAFHAEGFDTYFVRYSRMATTVLLLTRPFFKHRIFFWSSGQGDMRDPDGESLRVARRLKQAWNRVMLRSVDRVVTGPETMVGYMQQRWRLRPGHVVLLYNDLDVDRFAPGTEEERKALRTERGWDDAFVVLLVHRLAYRRGSRLLVPIIEQFASRVDNVRLVIAGEGPDTARLARDAAASSCSSSIELLGPVPNRDLPDLYRAADCFLMPSYEEGFPRVLLEAMATEVPVVTTTAGGSGDIVGEQYPYLVPIGDVDGMVCALADVHALAPDARAELGRALRRCVQDRFSTEKVADMLAALLSR